MRRVAFVDLDDTLFQTARKIDAPGWHPEAATVGAVDKAGRPLSYMLPAQRELFEALSETFELIPVTGRTESAFERVALPWRSLAVLHHGAVVRDASGDLAPLWAQAIRPGLEAAQPALEAAHARLERELPEGSRLRLHTSGGLLTYVSLKSGDDDGRLERFVTGWPAPAGLAWMANDRNAALFAQACSKRETVRHLLAAWRAAGPVLAVGLGDSEGDLGFLRACDFYLTRPGTQIDRALGPLARS
jgi:hypothetical protein